MLKQQSKPKWFLLYALVVLMIGVFVFEGKDGLPSWANELVSFGIVIFVFTAMILWVHINSSALWQEELRNIHPEEFRIHEYPPRLTPRDWQDEIHDLVESKQATIR
ncbi:MAG: hypothetical protein HZB51_05830 [Chloroflexi bacterium]|nr:hypothetical protein [Chloroflexota bacterium]